PDWIQPQTAPWYANLALEAGGYNYPWRSKFVDPTAEMILTARILSYLNRDSRILDVGCGHGEFTYQFADRCRAIVGIDIVEGFVTTANARKHEDSVQFFVVDAEQGLPFEDRYFDVVYTKKGPWLYHEGTTEGHRITKLGGIVLGLYHGGTDGGLRRLFPGLYSPFKPDHIHNLRLECEAQL